MGLSGMAHGLVMVNLTVFNQGMIDFGTEVLAPVLHGDRTELCDTNEMQVIIRFHVINLQTHILVMRILLGD